MATIKHESKVELASHAVTRDNSMGIDLPAPVRPAKKRRSKTVKRPRLDPEAAAAAKRKRETSDVTNPVDTVDRRRVSMHRDMCAFLEVHGPLAGISQETLIRIRGLVEADNWDGWLYPQLLPGERWKFFSEIQPRLVDEDDRQRCGRRLTRSSGLPIDVATDKWGVTGGALSEVLRPFNNQSATRVRLRFLNDRDDNERLSAWIKMRDRKLRRVAGEQCSRVDFLCDDSGDEDEEVLVVGEINRKAQDELNWSMVSQGMASDAGLAYIDLVESEDERVDTESIVSVEADLVEISPDTQGGGGDGEGVTSGRAEDDIWTYDPEMDLNYESG